MGFRETQNICACILKQFPLMRVSFTLSLSISLSLHVVNNTIENLVHNNIEWINFYLPRRVIAKSEIEILFYFFVNMHISYSLIVYNHNIGRHELGACLCYDATVKIAAVWCYQQHSKMLSKYWKQQRVGGSKIGRL